MTYADELTDVPAAFKIGIGAGTTVQRPPDRPLVAVGSGGSLSAATLLADVHQALTGHVARPMTPQGLLAAPPGPAATIVVCSASGANADAVAIGNRLADLGGERIIVLTGSQESPLSEVAAAASTATVVFDRLPGEGFVATSSLASLAGIIAAWYLDEGDRTAIASQLRRPWWSIPANTWEADTILVMHGAMTTAAATDIESKFVEGRLGHVQVCDHRNFSHGRFHWPMARPDCAALVLATADDAALARRTMAMLPESLPVADAITPLPGPAGAVQALLGALWVIAEVGAARALDPGHTPTDPWGRLVYLDAGLDEESASG